MEGSVQVDNGSPVGEVNTGTSEATESKESEVKETPVKEGEGEVKYTEKGTKLDPNPESAVHQELANAKRTIQQMTTVLKSPELLRRYAKESGMTLEEAKEEIKEKQEQVEEEFSAEKLQTGDDVARALNEIKKGYGKETQTLKETIKNLQSKLDGMSNQSRVEKAVSTLGNDISSVRGKYDQLDPKMDKDGKPTNPNYNPELENHIGALYKKLDIDEQTGVPRGNVSLAEVADAVMIGVESARKAGSQEAQTVIKEKRAGRIVTTSKGVPESESEDEDAGTTIANRISKYFKK
jgi:hypothetical protein